MNNSKKLFFDHFNKNKLEYQSSLDDLFLDFTYEQYIPLISNLNITNRLKSSNILVNSFKDTEYENMFRKLINNLKLKFGIDRTIWGIKNVNGNLEWELYFYSHPSKFKMARSIAVEFFDLPHFNKILPDYFMWSFDINSITKASGADINLYISHKESLSDDLHLLGGISYSYNGVDHIYQNSYVFWKNVVKNLDIIKKRIINSPFGYVTGINSDLYIDNILIPEFLEWYSNEKSNKNQYLARKHISPIATCNKQNCDSIYYLYLNIDMLIVFLKKLDYPEKQIKFLENNKEKLDHLLYDVSINYKVEDNGSVSIIKSGYYGQI